MTFQGDPFRTLGIAPSASLNEIRSAYRRLAKQYHPDAAGDRALPRFLAIQAAYERLVDSEGRLRPPPGGTGSSSGRPREPWRADSTRARASREAWRARRAGGSTAAGGPRPAGTSGGAGAASMGAQAGGDGAAGAGGEAPPRERHTRRGFRKATPGSTTYDEAADAPLDPAWEGGSWYGPSSRTYWTINPREYADPRKHGPEYQARARRATRAEADGTSEAAASGGPSAAAGAATRDTAADPSANGAGAEAPAADPAEANWGWSGSESTTTDGGEAGWGTHGWAYEEAADDAPPRRTRRRSRTTTDDVGAEVEPLPDLEAVARRAAPANLLALARRPGWRWRLAIALIAWPPVGYGVGTLLATVTGCAQFSASCPEPLPLLSLAVQPLVVAALFALPPAAAVGAFATIVSFAVAVPVATVLSVGPGSSGKVGAILLGVAVTAAYFVAMVAGAIAIWRPRREPQGAGPPP